MTIKRIFILIGYLFIAIISVLSAFRVEEMLWRCSLIASATVSLVLAIIRLIDSRRTTEEIEELRNNQLDVKVENGTLEFVKGPQNKS